MGDPGEEVDPLAERIGSYLWGYDGHEETKPWETLADDSFDRRAYVKQGAALAVEFGLAEAISLLGEAAASLSPEPRAAWQLRADINVWLSEFGFGEVS